MPTIPISPAQCRAARALLDVDIRKFAQISNVSGTTISKFERGQPVNWKTVLALKVALEGEGVELSETGDKVCVKVTRPAP